MDWHWWNISGRCLGFTMYCCISPLKHRAFCNCKMNTRSKRSLKIKCHLLRLILVWWTFDSLICIEVHGNIYYFKKCKFSRLSMLEFFRMIFHEIEFAFANFHMRSFLYNFFIKYLCTKNDRKSILTCGVLGSLLSEHFYQAHISKMLDEYQILSISV